MSDAADPRAPGPHPAVPDRQAGGSGAAPGSPVDAEVGPVSLSISLVTHRPDLLLLGHTLRALDRAVEVAERSLLLTRVHIAIVDNTPERAAIATIRHCADTALGEAAADVEYRHGHGNPGYGGGHNLALLASDADYHLVLNPDVVMAETAIAEGLRYLERHRHVTMLAPAVAGTDGATQYLAKRHPTPFDLFLRGFAPAPVRRLFARRLERFEFRDRIGEEPFEGVEVASGCFMLLRGPTVRALGGFDPRYFLYFEDFDLCVRLAAHGPIAFVPWVRIVHHGGGAARKGWRHLGWFTASALRFFARHGSAGSRRRASGRGPGDGQ